MTEPCVKCGYCCKKGPCGHGVWNETKSQCSYLTEDNLCEKYHEIIKDPFSRVNPAFGFGCCSPLMNNVRQEKTVEDVRQKPYRDSSIS